jgi:hypothetical protein
VGGFFILWWIGDFAGGFAKKLGFDAVLCGVNVVDCVASVVFERPYL